MVALRYRTHPYMRLWAAKNMEAVEAWNRMRSLFKALEELRRGESWQNQPGENREDDQDNE